MPEADEVKEMIIAHITAVDNHPACHGAWKHIIIEANMSYISADEVASWCHRLPRVMIESQDPANRQRRGVWTGPYEKESYAYSLREKVKDLNIGFCTQMIGEPADIQKNKAMLIEQMRNFRMDRQEPNDPTFGKYKYAFTGKTKGGSKDDYVLTVMMLDYWGTRARERMEMQMWAKANGIRLH